jgi:hypothetical protein
MNIKYLIVVILCSISFNRLNAEENGTKIDTILTEKVEKLEIDVKSLKEENSMLKNKLNDLDNKYIGGGILLFLFGSFCALWAQNTRRDPWLWFFLGLIFNIIAVLGVLIRNREDLKV